MGKIIIGIDASRATKEKISGIEYYSQEIIKNIIDLDHDRNNRFVLYAPKSLKKLIPGLPPHVSLRIIPFWRLWTQLRLAWETIVHQPSVLFVPAHTIPFFCRGKVVVTVHDLGFKHYPNLYPFLNRLYHNLAMNFSVRRANHIITISKATEKDILKFYPRIDAEKITVIYHGYDRKKFRPAVKEEHQSFKEKYGPYILFLGRLEYKKNIKRIVETYVQIRCQNKSVAHKLVLAGSPKYGFEEIKTLIESLPRHIQEDIIVTGYVKDSEVPRIIREADIFLFPSLFEGFGMPVIEAFASGVPVVTSKTTSLPEIAGGAALLVDPYKTNDIVAACLKLITNRKYHQTLKTRGLTRAKDFSWRKASRATLDILIKTARS
jgi:glycosyltransferase involved in cell wall biosynthesis